MNQLRKGVDTLLEVSLVIFMALMVINVLVQVLVRFLGISLPFTEELAGYLLIWVGLLGAGYATGKRMHLAIDLLPQKASPEGKKVLNRVIYAVVAIFALAVMVVGGMRLVYITLTLEQVSPVMQIPKGYIYLVLPLSGIFVIFYSILNILEYKVEESNS